VSVNWRYEQVGDQVRVRIGDQRLEIRLGAGGENAFRRSSGHRNAGAEQSHADCRVRRSEVANRARLVVGWPGNQMRSQLR
jgi:hypothetical protein